MIVITIGISALLSWGRIQDYASQPAVVQAHEAVADQVTGDGVQHVRADPRPAGHRGAGRAHDHLRVLHRHDQDLADRDAAPGNRVRGQGDRVHRRRARRRAGDVVRLVLHRPGDLCHPAPQLHHRPARGAAGGRSAAGCSWPCAGCLVRHRRAAAAHRRGDHGIGRAAVRAVRARAASCRAAGRYHVDKWIPFNAGWRDLGEPERDQHVQPVGGVRGLLRLRRASRSWRAGSCSAPGTRDPGPAGPDA